jgi:aerobic-type carbon monoxide dehydrogenase small subunit (CoxS/CutS family)
LVALVVCGYCKNGMHTQCMDDYESPNKNVSDPMELRDGGKACKCCGRGEKYSRKKWKEEHHDDNETPPWLIY